MKREYQYEVAKGLADRLYRNIHVLRMSESEIEIRQGNGSLTFKYYFIDSNTFEIVGRDYVTTHTFKIGDWATDATRYSEPRQA